MASQITPRERVWRALRHEPIDRVPVDFWAEPEIWWDESDIHQKIDELNKSDEYFIRCHVGSILEWTWALRGFEQTFMNLATGSAIPIAIFERLTKFLIEFGEKVLDASEGRIDAVFTWDDLGTQSSLLVSPKIVREQLVPRHRWITDAFHKYDVSIFFL